MPAPIKPIKPDAMDADKKRADRAARLKEYNASPKSAEAKRLADKEIAKIQPNLDALKDIAPSGFKKGGKVGAKKTSSSKTMKSKGGFCW